MFERACIARAVPRAAVIVAALALAADAGAQAAVSGAGAHSAGAERPSWLDLRVLPRLAPSRGRSAWSDAPSRLPSAAASLPDPRALRDGGADAEDARLRFNLKGFSLLEMHESQGAHFQVRRIRDREMRRPALSVTLEKRF